MARRIDPAALPRGIRLLIVDDHALFCAGLELLFRRERGIRDVACATELHEAARLAGRFVPQVVLARPRLNDTSPYEVARALRLRCPAARLVFLDDSVCLLNVRTAVEVGVSGYWTKHASFAEVAAGVGVVAAGGTAFSPRVRRWVASTPDGLEFRPPATSKVLRQLSPREMEVHAYLARGLTVKQCARRMGLAPSTVDNHKLRLMRKLGVHKTVDLAVLAVREGLLD